VNLVRSWTVPGDPPLTITIYQPAMTLRYGDGPEVALNPEQIGALNTKFAEADHFFTYEDPEIFG
jgi:hypothetical protein